ncbi:hypothetical protein J2S59_003494 [Nocardioides massiliensis]|uniref:Integrase catalytic domain-containing protein n=1 Tax=Nocardioides massiliensis TaxID=1325935 RepID=A0ABT9NV53_9ACTN|nr:hypothetical protein [Nocardioides massiliensis]
MTKRQWDTGVLNAVWVGDISYLRTWEGWLYLATVIDAHSRRAIGWAIADHMRTDLVEDALKMAITLRGELPARVVFHTDRGAQYASEQITTFAAENGIARSMGYTGICWDNAMAKSFFATLKTEFYYRRIWPTRAGAKLAVGDWTRTAITGDEGTPPSGRSARSPSRCNTPTRPRQHLKPHNPVSTVRGQGHSVMSPTQRALGRLAVKSRLSRSGNLRGGLVLLGEAVATLDPPGYEALATRRVRHCLLRHRPAAVAQIVDQAR